MATGHEGLKNQQGRDNVTVSTQPGVNGHLEHRFAHLMRAEDEGDAEKIDGPCQLRELRGYDPPVESVAKIAKGLGGEREKVHQIRRRMAEVLSVVPASRPLDEEFSQSSSECDDAGQDRGRKLPSLMAQDIGNVKGGPFAHISSNIGVLVVDGTADLDPETPSPPSRKENQEKTSLSVATSGVEDGIA